MTEPQRLVAKTALVFSLGAAVSCAVWLLVSSPAMAQFWYGFAEVWRPVGEWIGTWTWRGFGTVIGELTTIIVAALGIVAGMAAFVGVVLGVIHMLSGNDEGGW